MTFRMGHILDGGTGRQDGEMNDNGDERLI